MSVIDPRTGLPVSPSRNISDDDLIKVLTSLRIKVDMLNQQNMQLGLYVEFIMEHLLSMTDSEGEPLLTIDVKDFPEFAEKRMRQIQAELAEHQAQVETQTAESVLQALPEGMGTEIQLNE